MPFSDHIRKPRAGSTDADNHMIAGALTWKSLEAISNLGACWNYRQGHAQLYLPASTALLKRNSLSHSMFSHLSCSLSSIRRSDFRERHVSYPHRM